MKAKIERYPVKFAPDLGRGPELCCPLCGHFDGKHVGEVLRADDGGHLIGFSCESCNMKHEHDWPLIHLYVGSDKGRAVMEWVVQS